MGDEPQRHDTTGITVRGKLVARTIGNITQPSNMVTFCSSIFRNPGIYKLSGEFSPGSDLVVPHIFAQTEIWAPYIGLTGDINPAHLSRILKENTRRSSRADAIGSFRESIRAF